METTDARKRREEEAARELATALRAVPVTNDNPLEGLPVRDADDWHGFHGARCDCKDDTDYDDGYYSYDAVERPEHYTHSRVEVWDAIDAWGLGYRLGNVVKYVARADRKGNALEDLRKARAYLDREIATRQQDARDW
jgi:hypothetical protein